MNLFESILAKANPLPDVKSQFMSGFQQPQQPIPQKKPSMTLFSDEYTMLGKMKADGLSDDEAINLLKQRRTDLLEGRTNLDQKEQSILLKMQADNLSAKEATALLKQRRADQFEKKYQEGNLLQKGAYNTLMAGAGNLETVLKYGGNALDFVTFGQLGFGEDVKRMEQVTQSPEFDSTAFKAGTYLPDVALSVSPIGAGYLAGAKTMGGLALRSGVVGAGFGATQPILEQGSDVSAGDIATGAAMGAGMGVVATPILAKTFKYGKAGYYGGLEGAGKSIVRDVKGGLNAITPSGANISTKANRFNANEIREFTKTTGQSPGEFATSRGMTKVGDDAVVEATRLWQASKEQADKALTAIKGRFRFTDEGEDLLKTTIDDLETRLINTKSPEARRISQLKAKYEDSGLTMSEINEVKRAYANNYKYSFVDAGSEGALRSRNLQDAIRKWQFKVAEENGLTNLKEINKTTQGWKMFADSLSKKIQGSSGNNNVSLTDWITLSGGGPENIALYLGKKLASSDKVKSGAIKLFSKKTKPSIIQASMGDIQNSNFLKNVNRGVSGVGDNSGGKSLVRPVGLLPAPSGKATGAKNFRANQPMEKSPIKNDKQVGERQVKKEAQKLLPAPRLPAGTSLPIEIGNEIEKDLITIEGKKFNGNPIIVDGKKVGGVSYRVYPNESKTIELSKIEIFPEYRGNNYAKKVIEKIFNDNPSSKEISLSAAKTAEPIWEKLGFEYKEHITKEGKLYKISRDKFFGKSPNPLSQQKTVKPSPQVKPVEKVETMTKGEAILYRKNGKIYAKDNQATRDALKRSGIDIEPDGEIKKQLTFYPEDDFRPDVAKKKTIKPVEKTNLSKNAKQQVSNPNASDTIPEGYFKDIFGEIQPLPSNKKGGFIRLPFTSKLNVKPQPKQLFAGENAKAPPKGKTGWFKGADGKMRFEIDDSVAKINIGNEDITKLGKILSHDELFKQYPELKNLDVELNKNIKGAGIYSDNLIRLNTDTVGGLLAQKNKQWQQALSYKPTESDIKMLMSDGISKEKATELFKNIQNKRALKIEKEIEDIKSKGYIDDADIKSTLLHEIQHYIQMKEGFARGSDPILENKIIAKEVQKKIDAVNEKMMKNKEGMDSMSDSEFEQMKIRHKELEAQRSELEDKMDRLRKYESEGFDQYNRSAGEVEARNVQSRMNLTAKERTIKSPESTEDVPRVKQIIRMNSKGPSMLIKTKPLSPQKKVLTPKKQSATMGNMETKKLIEEAKILPSGIKIGKISDNIDNVIESNFDTSNREYFTQSRVLDTSSLKGKNDSLYELPAQKTRIEKLAKDIKETNEISPIVIDEKFNVIEGQHRLRAMKLLGEKQIPVIQIRKGLPIRLIKGGKEFTRDTFTKEEKISGLLSKSAEKPTGGLQSQKDFFLEAFDRAKKTGKPYVIVESPKGWILQNKPDIEDTHYIVVTPKGNVYRAKHYIEGAKFVPDELL